MQSFDYVYRITETQGNLDRFGNQYIPDQNIIYAKVTVTKSTVIEKTSNSSENQIIYSVGEPEYFLDQECTQKLSGGAVFVNTPVTETTDLTVEKRWTDEDRKTLNEDEYKDLSATVKLYYKLSGSDQSPVPVPKALRDDCQVVLSNSNGWTHTWEGLPKRTVDNTEYIYYVSEEPVSGFTVDYDPKIETGGKYFGGYEDNKDSEDNKNTGNDVTIINERSVSYNLPATGGEGTRMIYILSMILVAFAGIGLIAVRRRREEAG